LSRMRKRWILAGGLLASLAIATGAPAGPTATSAATVTTTVRVTAGKPSEFRYTLSKRTVTAGTVVFRVTNRGQVRHDFRIAGKRTARLATGKSGTLRVTLKAGRYQFVCTLPGHSAAGMKGTLTVKKAPTPVTVTAGKPSEFRYTLSKRTVKKGAVTFTVVNRGKVRHDFRILGKKTKSLAAGTRQKLTVTFRRAGRYQYVCTLPGHAAAGMKGTFTVT
jgi:uncharacterized cupredoxin-like copper-binding protein